MRVRDAIDAGSESIADYGYEANPNGCAANLGAYGNTPEAAFSDDDVHCP